MSGLGSFLRMFCFLSLFYAGVSCEYIISIQLSAEGEVNSGGGGV